MNAIALAGVGAGLLQQLLGTLQAGHASAAGQTSPGDKAGPAGFAGPPQGSPLGPPPGPPPQKPAGSASDRFRSDTLATLISAQEAPKASDLVNKLITRLDTDGDGQVSLDEIQSALSKPEKASTTGTAQQPDRSAAFAQIDTSGDGQLSADELLAALNAMHKHHHRHGAQSATAANANASSTTLETAETAATATAAVTTEAPQNAAA